MIISIEEYKRLSKSNENDERLELLIEQVEYDYLRIRNKPFDKKNGEIVYPVGSKITASKMVSYLLTTLPGSVGLTSESIGDYSASFETSANMMHGYPKEIISSIKRYGMGK